jgi:predicted dehydrogenase
MEKIKFALVGCGNIAKKHSHVISNFLENAEIRCFCDKELSRAEKFGRNTIKNILTILK